MWPEWVSKGLFDKSPRIRVRCIGKIDRLDEWVDGLERDKEKAKKNKVPQQRPARKITV